MNLDEAFGTGRLSLLGMKEELSFEEFFRWLRARAGQLEQVCRGENYEPRLELGDWIDLLADRREVVDE